MGWHTTAQALQTALQQPCVTPPTGYSNHADNLAFAYNRQALKLLTAIAGQRVDGYRDWCARAKPFTQGAAGYFKLNLFPLAFRDTQHNRWSSEHVRLTGLADKAAYLAWCRAKRLPRLRAWAAQAQPRLIVCVGKSHRQDFKQAFHDADARFEHRHIDDRDLWWALNAQGTLVVIAPFLLGPHGLNRNRTLQQFGEQMAQLLPAPA